MEKEILAVKKKVAKEKKTLICVITLFGVFALFLIGYKAFKKNSLVIEDALPAVTIETATLGPVVRYINAIGTLRPFNSVVIKSEVNSVISKIHFTEGTFVEEGTLLVELDAVSARASLRESEALYNKAKSEFEPTEKLADKGVMAKIERDKRKAEMDMYAAKVASAKNYLEKHKIFAPFKGIVGLKEISIGQYVAPGNELAKLVDYHPLKVDFKVAEVDIGSVYIGQNVKFFVGGDNSQEYEGQITAIDPESDKISHSFNVRAVLDVPEYTALSSRALRPGVFVSVKIAPDEGQFGVLIAESSLDKIGQDYFVYKIAEGLAVRTPVTVGMRKKDAVEIITGINEGDTVVTSGQTGVLDGKGVSIQAPEISDSLSTLVKQARSLNKAN